MLGAGAAAGALHAHHAGHAPRLGRVGTEFPCHVLGESAPPGVRALTDLEGLVGAQAPGPGAAAAPAEADDVAAGADRARGPRLVDRLGHDVAAEADGAGGPPTKRDDQVALAPLADSHLQTGIQQPVHVPWGLPGFQGLGIAEVGPHQAGEIPLHSGLQAAGVGAAAGRHAAAVGQRGAFGIGQPVAMRLGDGQLDSVGEVREGIPAERGPGGDVDGDIDGESSGGHDPMMGSRMENKDAARSAVK